MNKMLKETYDIAQDLHMKNPYVTSNIFKRWIVWKRLEIILNSINHPEKTLDFGTGVGMLLPSISKLSKNVYCCDVDQKSLEIAQQLVKKAKVTNVHFSVAMPENELKSFKSKTFDCIVAADVLEHIPHVASVISEFHRVLTDNGSLVVSLPTESWFYSLFSNSEESGHINSLKDLINTLVDQFELTKSHNLYGFFKIVECKKIC